MQRLRGWRSEDEVTDALELDEEDAGHGGREEFSVNSDQYSVRSEW